MSNHKGIDKCSVTGFVNNMMENSQKRWLLFFKVKADVLFYQSDLSNQSVMGNQRMFTVEKLISENLDYSIFFFKYPKH